jgi:hypothetical protein
MVAHGRQTHLSACRDDSDHGGRRRKQRVEVVETGIAEVRRSDRIVYIGLPLSCWHKQIEQDRAPSVFLYFLNLRGEPLRDYETAVHLIAKTTAAKGLNVTCRLDRRKYRQDAREAKRKWSTSTWNVTSFMPSGTTSPNQTQNQGNIFIYLRLLTW